MRVNLGGKIMKDPAFGKLTSALGQTDYDSRHCCCMAHRIGHSRRFVGMVAPWPAAQTAPPPLKAVEATYSAEH